MDSNRPNRGRHDCNTAMHTGAMIGLESISAAGVTHDQGVWSLIDTSPSRDALTEEDASSSLYDSTESSVLQRYRPLTRSEGVQVLEIQTDPRWWVQSDAGFPLRIRLDRLLWTCFSGFSSPVRGCIPAQYIPTPSPWVAPISFFRVVGRYLPTYLLSVATLFDLSLFLCWSLSFSF